MKRILGGTLLSGGISRFVLVRGVELWIRSKPSQMFLLKKDDDVKASVSLGGLLHKEI